MNELTGVTLGSTNSQQSGGSNVGENVRNVWANKFGSSSTNEVGKVIKTEKKDLEANSESQWETVDDDVMIREVKNEIIELNSSDDEDDEFARPNNPPRPSNSQGFLDHSQAIKKELFDDLGVDSKDIEFIDDDFDEYLKDESLEIQSDSSVVDEIFGEDTLMKDFNNINNVIMNDKENKGNLGREIIACPICQDQMPRDDLSSHLEGCTGIQIQIKAKSGGRKAQPKQTPFYKKLSRRGASTSTAGSSKKLNNTEIDSLLKAGYSKALISSMLNETKEDREYNNRIAREMREERQTVLRNESNAVSPVIANAEIEEVKHVKCPVCDANVLENEVNNHLDECLTKFDA